MTFQCSSWHSLLARAPERGLGERFSITNDVRSVGFRARERQATFQSMCLRSRQLRDQKMTVSLFMMVPDRFDHLERKVFMIGVFRELEDPMEGMRFLWSPGTFHRIRCG